MADSAKHFHGGGGGPFVLVFELCTILRNRRTVTLAYALMFTFVAFTVFLVLNPSSNPSSYPFLTNIFGTGTSAASSSASSSADDSSVDRSRVSSIFSYFFFPNSTSPVSNSSKGLPSSWKVPALSLNRTSESPSSANVSLPPLLNSNQGAVALETTPVSNRTQVRNFVGNSSTTGIPEGNVSPTQRLDSPQMRNFVGNLSSTGIPEGNVSPPLRLDSPQIGVTVKPHPVSNRTHVGNSSSADTPAENLTRSGGVAGDGAKPGHNQSLAYKKKNDDTHQKKSARKGVDGAGDKQNQISSPPLKEQDTVSSALAGSGKKAAADDPLESLRNCDFFDGDWVRDDSYPLYKPGSCSLIDEQFNCILNGRPDKYYQKLKWKPKGCNLPRLNGSKMLELLRGKRLAFVGDSLNRNMWESLVCILRGTVKDQTKVYEVNGRMIFRGEASYSFFFKDYGLTIDFFVSPFLVREWEVRNKDGSTKETLRLDLIGLSCDQYKGADILVFNTGHWWTHDKTSKGEDYYQEGSHVYKELNVVEAFRKALTTWGRWVDVNVDPSKTLVFFRGYSDSHFSGGQWNSGGQCDSETEPIKNSTYLREYPPKMEVLERVLKGMKTPVAYLNVTRMTDYRKDGHPSIYRKQHLTDEERRSPLRYQDCSHWCLPGVPDTWNEILYAELLVLQQQKRS